MASFEVRGKSIRAVVRLPGGIKKSATFDTKSEARKWAMLMEAKVDAAGPPVGKTNMDLLGLTLMQWPARRIQRSSTISG